MKTCTKCGDAKEENEENFYRIKRTGKFRSCCKACHNADNIARAAANPGVHNARSKAWRDAHPEQHIATVRAWQRRNPERFQANTKRYQYGIDFDALWVAQNGLCASCHEPMTRNGKEIDSVCVDHDRSCCSGKKSCGKCVRGLIHRNCNLVLGYAKDDVKVLRCAIEYLERWQSRPASEGGAVPFMGAEK